MSKKKIKITCEGKELMTIGSLREFQDDMKELPDHEFMKLRKLILKHGFASPIDVWSTEQKDDSGSFFYILDGHQRLKTVQRMIAEEGYVCHVLPVTLTHAPDFKSAKEICLGMASVFGKMNSVNLHKFLENSKIEADKLVNEFSLPDLNAQKFLNEFFTNVKGGETEQQAEVYIPFDQTDIEREAFRYFRKKGFPYPKLELFEMKQELNRLAALGKDDCLRSTIGYRIADHFNPHRFAAAAIGMSSPLESFNDDDRLRKAIAMEIKNGGRLRKNSLPFITLVNGTQACSNFRPAFAKMLYNEYAPNGGRVFDSSTGYGGRLVGFLASHCSAYYGTDPNKPTFDGNCKLHETVGQHKEVHLFNSPIEDLNIDEFKGSLDFAFTSPPYFVKELYSADPTQSCVRYPDYEAWLQGFLKPMLKKNFDVLKSKAFCVINIEDVKIKNKLFKLVDPTIELGKQVGFDLVETKLFQLQSRTLVRDGVKVIEEGNERVIVFRKK